MNSLLSRMTRRQENATAAFALATRASGTVSAALSAILAVVLLSPARIGLFLSFAGLAALSAIADLGLNQSVLLASASKPADDPMQLRRAGLIVLVPTVLVTGAVQFLIGAAFLSHAPGTSFLPWGVFCLLSSLYQCLYLFVVIVEGTNRRLAAWRANFILEVLGGAALLAALAARHELWGFAAGMAVRSTLILALFHNEFTTHWMGQPGLDLRGSARLWRTQILPMQWKTAVNMFSGIITTRLLTPILLVTNDAVTAGRIGLGLSLTGVISAATAAWPQSETALYVQLFHERSFARLFQRFRNTCAKSLAVCVVVSVLAGLAVALLRDLRPDLASKLPSLSVLVPLLAAAPLTHLTYALAIALRSQRDDPVVMSNSVFSVLLLLVFWWAARQGPNEFCWMYLIGATAGMALYAAYYWRWRRSLQL